MSSETKQCRKCNTDYVVEAEDFGFYEKMGVPAPVECPDCRFQRRLAFMNVRSLYRRTCDLCNGSTLSIYRPELDMTVYCQKCFWSDNWDPMDYSADYDPDTPFLQQLEELRRRTPHAALISQYSTMVNSEYCNYTAFMKNSYLCYFADYGENVLYSYVLAHVKDSMDCAKVVECELCYELEGGYKSYQVFYSTECSECRDVWFSKDCVGCTDCIGCVNLRKKQYCIFNEQYTKEEYEQKKKEMNLGSYDSLMKLKKKAEDFWMQQPVKYMYTNSISVDVSGDYVFSSKNAKYCYLAENVEDSKFVQMITVASVKNCYDYTCWGANTSFIYECTAAGENSQNLTCCYECWPNVNDLQYCLYTHSSHDCFGCANIKNKEYCILNKQYTKEEYNTLKAQIIADMDSNPYIDKQGNDWRYGYGLPTELSVFAYNETDAQLYFPLEKDQVVSRGFEWYDKKVPTFQITKKGSELPDTITEVDDSILDEIISCEETGRAYRIVRDELDMLRRFNLPLPRRHPDIRLEERYKNVNKPKFYKRVTSDGKEVLTTYSPDDPREILSEEEYNRRFS
jgi:hypothetical protein